MYLTKFYSKEIRTTVTSFLTCMKITCVQFQFSFISLQAFGNMTDHLQLKRNKFPPIYNYICTRKQKFNILYVTMKETLKILLIFTKTDQYSLKAATIQFKELLACYLKQEIIFNLYWCFIFEACHAIL